MIPFIGDAILEGRIWLVHRKTSFASFCSNSSLLTSPEVCSAVQTISGLEIKTRNSSKNLFVRGLGLLQIRQAPSLTDAYPICTFVCMRTTINLDDELVAKAQVYTGVKEKTRLIHLGLEALIQREAALRLAALGGTAPGAKAGRRRRSADPQKLSES
jgi:Arc/MetJ family transcription regulator